MASSFVYLSKLLNNPEPRISFLFDGKEPPPGEVQYFGPHFLAPIWYAVKLGSNNDDEFAILEQAALDCELRSSTKILGLMASFLTQIREFFTVNPNSTIEIMASFIEFLLVDVLERLSRCSCSWIIIPCEIDILHRRLNFLLIVIRDTPFQLSTELEQRNNILGEIKCVANEAGMFLHAFFFTANPVSTTKMGTELDALLLKLEVVEETIKKHFAMILEHQKVTTSNLTSTYIYIVDSLLDDLNHLFNRKTDLVLEVKDQITALHEGLYSCRSMLRDMELLQNKELKECEMQLIDVSYQAEHLIACFAAGDLPDWYLALRLASFIQRSISIRVSLTTLKLNSSISSVQVAESSSKVSSPQFASKSISMTDDTIIGFKEIRRNIASDLIGGLDRLEIISIIGMGGLGKTTIARNLYNDNRVLLRFDKRCWCVVSQTYQKRKLLMVILSSISKLDKDEISKMEEHQLAERVYKSLKRTRYLFVMDDIWEKQAWDDLKRYFPDDANGSRILFTSRNKDVALQASSEPIIHNLPLLSTEESWDLLQKKVFPNSFCPQQLEDVGKEIARNCKGLPLAIVGIAAILANTYKKKSSWKEVATKLSSYVSKEQDVLELSYWHLPLHLKRCFLFLGVFEEDKEIVTRELIHLWVSAGLIPKNEHKISEDVAENYLLELINRNMVQVVKKRSDNGVKSFTMHDLMRDMCSRLGDTENFVKVINEKSSIQEQHHHIYIESQSYDFTRRPFGPHIRLFFSYFLDLSHLITSSMKRLRILKLSKAGIFYGMTLEFLFHLRHLEYAGELLNFHSHVNLEFLSIGGCEFYQEFQLNMPKLRHLQFGHYFRYRPLKLLDISHAHSLQTLSGVQIFRLEDEESLRRFSQLRHLRCIYRPYMKKCSPDFSFLTQLVSLHISFSAKLKAISFPIHIKKLSISGMILSCTMLSSIGTLAHLEILKLSYMEFEGRRWNTNDGEFQTLKFLKLTHEIEIEEWNTSEDHFPVLEQLVLKTCSLLKLIPSDLGYIPTLQRIEVFDCTEEIRNSANHIQEEQEEVGNEQLKVIISGAFEEEDEDEDEDKNEDGDEDE